MSAKILSTYFECLLYGSTGEQFQRVFNDLMTRVHANFRPVQPWGAAGDRGNDGYIDVELRFFQLYAPSSAKPSAKSACDKAEKDFAKLLSSYKDLKHYHFVLNDRFGGIPHPLELTHKAIKAANPQLEECFPVGSHDLRSRFEALPHEKQTLIVGEVPATRPQGLDFSVLGALLRDLADADEDGLSLGRIDLPSEFEVKADFNKFSLEVKHQLMHYARRSYVVDRMLEQRNASWVQAVADEVGARYRDLQGGSDSDAKVHMLVEALVPGAARSHPHTLKVYREAALLVIAKYFEACDVFENPNSPDPAETR